VDIRVAAVSKKTRKGGVAILSSRSCYPSDISTRAKMASRRRGRGRRNETKISTEHEEGKSQR